MTTQRLALLLSLLLLPACGDGSQTADIVQAATRTAAEAGQQLAEKAAELAELTPAEAKAKLQGVLDAAAVELKEIRDSETAQRIVAEVERVLDRLVELAQKLGQELDLAGLKASVVEMVEHFRNDPRVVSALEGLETRIEGLIGAEK